MNSEAVTSQCAPTSLAPLVLSAPFFVVVIVPVAMAFIAIWLRAGKRNPFVAPTDLLAVVFLADISVAIEPELLAPWVVSQYVQIHLIELARIAAVITFIAWFICVSKIEQMIGSAYDVSSQRFIGRRATVGAVSLWLLSFGLVFAIVYGHFVATTRCVGG